MKKTLTSLSFISGALLSVSKVYAARVYIETETVLSDPNKLTLFFKIDTEGRSINAIEGSFQLAGFSKNVTSIHTGGSAFTLWPNKPSLQGDIVSFVGGAPTGSSGEHLLLFTVTTSHTPTDESFISFGDIVAYENDGLGSQLQIVENPVKVSALHPVANRTPHNDTVPPETFSIQLGRDVNVFEGKYFISFSAVDAQSGIKHYEIKEGKAEPVRSSSPYVLQDQTRQSKITVTAIDNAGNVRSETYTSLPSFLHSTEFIILTVLVIALLALIIKKSRKLLSLRK